MGPVKGGHGLTPFVVSMLHPPLQFLPERVESPCLVLGPVGVGWGNAGPFRGIGPEGAHSLLCV